MEKTFIFLSQFLQSALSILKVCIRSSFFLKKHNSDASDLIILGNGPSIKNDFKEHLDFIKSKTTLCVNKFPDTDYYEIIKPEYFIVVSKGFFNDDAVDYNVELRKRIIDALIKKTNWDITFFLPSNAKKNKAFIEKIKSNKYIKLSFFNTTPVEGLTFFNHLFFKLRLGSPRPHNVLIPSILNGINAGFKKIFILGADHSWLPQISVNNKNEVLINQKHFYDENSSTPKQMHKNEGQGNRTLDEVLNKFMLSFRSYHELEKYSKIKNCSIYNSTPTSFIDAFERISIDKIKNLK